MALQRPNQIRPGEFGLAVAADSRRGVFDYHNEALLASGVPIAAVFIGDSITDMWALDAFFQSTPGHHGDQVLAVLGRGVSVANELHIGTSLSRRASDFGCRFAA